MSATDWPSLWKGGALMPCSWCGRERVRRDGTAGTCVDCQPYEAFALAVEAGDVA